MSLAQSDLQEIKNIVDSAFARQNEEVIKSLQDELQALRNDIKEIYDMLADLQKSTITDEEFKKRTLEEKLLALNAELLTAAKQAGISLPRS